MSHRTRTVAGWCFAATMAMIACTKPAPLEQALRYAGDNRSELEKVLTHYARREADSLKYRAACYLIEHMPFHYTYGGEAVEAYYERIDPLLKVGSIETLDSIKNRLRMAAGALTLTRSDVRMDIRHMRAEYLIRHIDRIFLTREYPWNREVDFRDFCEYVLPYRINNEPLEDWLPIYTLASKPIADTLYEQSHSYREFIEKIVSFYTERSPYIRTFEYPVEHRPSRLLNIRYGTCHEITMWVVYIFRALGIPVSLDYTPNWANRSKGHSWNSIRIDGVYYPFIFQDYTVDFGNHLKDRTFEKFSKVYRKTYAIEDESLFMLRPDEELPSGFTTPFMKDITALFAADCADAQIALDAPVGRRKPVFLLVFDNKEWTPAGWAFARDGHVRFNTVHRGCCYLAATYEGGEFRAVSDPFLVDEAGATQRIVADASRPQRLVLRRKYPLGSMRKYAERSLGGRFQGSDRPDFRPCETLHTVGHTLEDMAWHRVAVQARPYRYLRYLSAKNGYNSMAELRFIAPDGDTLRGKVIGAGELSTDPSSLLGNAFDGDPLTFFAAKEPDDAWVGLELERPAAVATIAYLFRNDDNNIRPGDLYELCHWDRGRWHSYGLRTATADSLVYEGCPSGALFVLKNHTRGTEQRIFTYADGRPKWW